MKSPVLQVAAWEFRRFFKLRVLLGSFALAIFGCSIGFVGGVVSKRSKSKPVDLAVVNETGAPLAPTPGSRLRFQSATAADQQRVMEEVGAKKLGGLLIWRADGTAELTVMRQPVWKDQLVAALTEAKRKQRLGDLQLSTAQLDELLAPVNPSVRFHDAAPRQSPKAEILLVLCLTALMLMAVFLSFSYQFIAITGEKQARVTEVILSAIKPQEWIDGKILGISLLALTTVALYAAAVLAVLGTLVLAGMIPIAAAFLNPFNWLLFLTMALGGLLFWNCFLGAIAATIADPLSSSRSSLMMIPAVFVAIAFGALKDPDTTFMRILTFAPMTSPTVLPARVVLGEIAWWEILLSLAILAGSIWFTRRIAGRIFEASILTYGKEPGFGELWRAIRRGPATA